MKEGIEPMKILKRFAAFLPVAAFMLIMPVSARADDLSAAVKTGDKGVIGIIIAVVAFIATAVITVKLTKYKNKKIK